MSMRKFYVMVLTLFTASLLGSVMVPSATAADVTLLAWWLVNGVEVGAGQELAGEAEGGLLLEDTKGGLFGEKAAILCTGILAGAAGFDGLGVVSEVLNLKHEKIGELGGLALLGEGVAGTDCVTESLCAEGSAASPIEVFPKGLPGHGLLELLELSPGVFSFVILGFGPGGYELLCLVAGINAEDECTTNEAEVEVINDPTTGDAEVPAGTTAEPLASCTRGGTGSAVTTTDELSFLNLTGGGLLTVSSEP